MLEWIDQQLPLIASEQVKKARSKTLRNQSASKVSRPNGSSKALGHKESDRQLVYLIRTVFPKPPERNRFPLGRNKAMHLSRLKRRPSNPTFSHVEASGFQGPRKICRHMDMTWKACFSALCIHQRVSKDSRKASDSIQTTKLPPSAGQKPLQKSLSVNIPPRRSTRKKREN